MAVYTDITDEELASLLADFDIGAPLSLKGVAEGVENSNFLLETEAGRFILTIYEKRVRADDLPYFLDLLTWLSGRGFPAPLRVRNAQAYDNVSTKSSCLPRGNLANCKVNSTAQLTGCPEVFCDSGIHSNPASSVGVI